MGDSPGGSDPRSLPPKGGVTPPGGSDSPGVSAQKVQSSSVTYTMSSQDGLCSYRFDTYRNCIKAAAASHSIPKNDREAATESNDKTREREGESGSKAMDSDLQAVE